MEHQRLPQTIVIAIDGIGFETFQKAQKLGSFSNFKSPARLQSIFPTVSDPNWNAIFALPPALGFTKNTFDPQADGGRGAVVGSLLSHLTDHPEYEKRFDHHIHSALGAATNLAWLETSLEIWIDDLPLRILESRGRDTFFAFTLNVDLISHTQGEAAVLKWLKKIHSSLTALETLYETRHAPRPEIVIISDHGNSYYESVQLIDVVAAMEPLGWTRGDTLETENSFVFVAPEILSVAGFWTQRKSPFAADLSRTPGVLFSMTRLSDLEIEIHASLLGKKPLLLRKDKALSHSAIVNLGLQSELNQHRLWEAFEIAASEPPTVIAVAKSGSAFSNPVLKVITQVKGLRSLHGALYKSESEGVFVSNKRYLPDIRPWEFRKFIDLKEFKPMED